MEEGNMILGRIDLNVETKSGNLMGPMIRILSDTGGSVDGEIVVMEVLLSSDDAFEHELNLQETIKKLTEENKALKQKLKDERKL